MLDNLTDGFAAIIKRIKGQARLSEANVTETLDLIRTTLIDADVALDVVDEFVATIRDKAMGQEVIGSLTPGQSLIGLVQQQLVLTLGEHEALLQQPGNDPLVVLLCGLQGSGKTTTAGKLALHLKSKRKRVLVASTDVHRPAAIEQLRKLCADIKVDFHEPGGDAGGLDAVERAAAAQAAAQQTLQDYLIVDTAGRNVIDKQMMQEIEDVSRRVIPAETLLVIDATQGQEALTVSRAFDEILALTGICLTKLDGDARGGAALSARTTVGVPIKFCGVGEKPENLEPFIPDRMASRILGMGDIVSLVESATAAMGQKRAAKLERKLRRKRSKGLELADMIDQLRQAEQMGGLDKITDQLPSGIASKVKRSNIDPRVFKRMEAIFLSMTGYERRNPHLINGARRARIASGAGVEPQQVNRLLAQHSQANKFMKMAAKNPIAAMNMLRGGLG